MRSGAGDEQNKTNRSFHSDDWLPERRLPTLAPLLPLRRPPDDGAPTLPARSPSSESPVKTLNIRPKTPFFSTPDREQSMAPCGRPRRWWEVLGGLVGSTVMLLIILAAPVLGLALLSVLRIFGNVCFRHHATPSTTPSNPPTHRLYHHLSTIHRPSTCTPTAHPPVHPSTTRAFTRWPWQLSSTTSAAWGCPCASSTARSAAACWSSSRA